MAKNNKKGTLSDKIADILSTKPGSIDPEDDIYEETKARVTCNDFEESENEDVLSTFRKQNVDLLEDVDSRYVGKKGSRKSLQNSDEGWETEEGLSTDEGEALDGIPGTQEAIETDDEDATDEEGSDERDSDEGSGSDHENDSSSFQHLKETNTSNYVKKGNCVRNQLSVWENLLEIRIQLQKCLITANKMPQSAIYSSLNLETDFKSEVSNTKKNVSNMLNKFLLLQSLLLKQFSETKMLLKNKNIKSKEDSDEEIPSDTEDEQESEKEDESNDEEVPIKRRKLSDFDNEISTREEKYKNYRNSVIQKWNEKTRLGIGKNNAGSNTVLQQIEYILSEKSKLLRRTHLKRTEYEIVGKKKENSESEDGTTKITDDYDNEIYDDNDFYHQLLRELIECKSSDVTDPIQMSRQWIALQSLRSKMKRKIDTKATKGRKIRYVVHSKLVNFMATIDYNLITDEAKNELYSSLFGNKQISSSVNS